MPDTATKASRVKFTVEMADETSPQLRVRVGETEVLLPLTAVSAGSLGRALLAASALCESSSPPEAGVPIENCHFPVQRWATGHSNTNGLPVLVIEVAGGTQLTLQWEQTLARECAESLARTAAGGLDLDTAE